MTYLLLFLSICFTAAMYVLFRVFDKYHVDGPQAIVYNYFTAGLLSLIIEIPARNFHYPTGMMLLACITGGVFMGIFVLISVVTTLIGVAGSTIISRMSLIIPAVFSVIAYNEKFTVTKDIGIILALAAIYFIVSGSARKDENKKLDFNTFLLYILVFAGTGIADTLLKIGQMAYMPNKPIALYFALIFFSAGIIGLLFILPFKSKQRKLLRRKNIRWGFILGICNALSLNLFFVALTKGFDGSVIFPINSLGIVIISSLGAWLLFKEHLKGKGIIGFILSLLSILLISK